MVQLSFCDLISEADLFQVVALSGPASLIVQDFRRRALSIAYTSRANTLRDISITEPTFVIRCRWYGQTRPEMAIPYVRTTPHRYDFSFDSTQYYSQYPRQH